MTETYASMSIDELISVFEDACLAQDETLFFPEDIDLYNQKMAVLTEVTQELNERGPEARLSLLRLLSHENAQVRLQAAQSVYPVARDEARKCLQDLASAKILFVSLSAGMTLHRLAEVPDCLDH
jgi:Fic family protein